MRYVGIVFALVVGIAVCDAQNVGAQGRGGRRGPDNAPKVGDVAPTFTLTSLDGKSETELENFRGDKPVGLFFGSYT